MRLPRASKEAPHANGRNTLAPMETDFTLHRPEIRALRMRAERLPIISQSYPQSCAPGCGRGETGQEVRNRLPHDA